MSLDTGYELGKGRQGPGAVLRAVGEVYIFSHEILQLWHLPATFRRHCSHHCLQHQSRRAGVNGVLLEQRSVADACGAKLGSSLEAPLLPLGPIHKPGMPASTQQDSTKAQQPSHLRVPCKRQPQGPW